MAEEVVLVTTRAAEATFSVAAGKSVKIETGPQGIDVMDEEVPEGKSWEVTIEVFITESDA